MNLGNLLLQRKGFTLCCFLTGKRIKKLRPWVKCKIIHNSRLYNMGMYNSRT